MTLVMDETLEDSCCSNFTFLRLLTLQILVLFEEMGPQSSIRVLGSYF